MTTERYDTKTKILETAAGIIGKERNLNLTIREIATRADVNIASVNYHFGSKEKLLEEVEMLLIEKIRHIYTNIHNYDQSTRERLINWADSLIKHLIDYPGIIYLIGTQVLEKENTGLSIYLHLLETDIKPLVKKLTGDTDETAVSYKVLQLISGIVYPVLIYSSNNETAVINIGDTVIRGKYVTSLVNSIEKG
ncbi:MAG: TetR/AcrR family transcriptional regulator [Dethiobacteria bacterium]